MRSSKIGDVASEQVHARNMPSLSAFFVALSPRTALYRSLFEKSRVPGIFSVVFRQPVAEIKYTVDNYIVGVLSPRGLWKMSWATPAMSIFSNYDWFLRNFSVAFCPLFLYVSVVWR